VVAGIVLPAGTGSPAPDADILDQAAVGEDIVLQLRAVADALTTWPWPRWRATRGSVTAAVKVSP
jgi:hypothetical protein